MGLLAADVTGRMRRIENLDDRRRSLVPPLKSLEVLWTVLRRGRLMKSQVAIAHKTLVGHRQRCGTVRTVTP